MFGTAVRYILFYIRHRQAIGAWTAKHATPLRKAFADARPLIDAFVAEEMPGAEQVKEVVAIARRGVVDNANPQQGDFWGPTNPNPNAG